MNKIEEFYKEAGGIEYDKFDKKADKFTYYDMIGFADAYHSKQLIIADVSDIVHRAELKVLENVSDYIPCEIYSQAVIFSQKKRDNVR